MAVLFSRRARVLARPTQSPVESLERRVLLAFSANVNFQPKSAPVPAGYVVDWGQAYGGRGNGFTYGWNADNSWTTRDRNSTASPDQRHDTLIHTQQSPNTNASWQIAVPNGSYLVKLVSGDAHNTNSVYKTNVEGVLAINGTPTSTRKWLTNTVKVSVSDGRLTVANAGGAVNNKLNFIDITDTPVVTIMAKDAAAAETKTGETPNAGQFTITRTGSTAAALTVNLSVKGSATAGNDYAALPAAVTIPAGAASVSLTVTPSDDAVVESAESVTVGVLSGPLHNAGAGAGGTATVTIADNDVAPPVNRPPATPTILEPVRDGEVVSGADVHMVTGAFSDSDAGSIHAASDWEIWTVPVAGSDATPAVPPEVVWQAIQNTGEGKIHIHFGDGQFVNSLAGKSELLPETDYVVRVRHRDGSNDPATEYSAWAERRFRTAPVIEPLPDAPDWTVDQPGYKVEVVPVRFAAGEEEFRLPVNIAFVPNPGPSPADPLFYVTELYGTIRVVTRDFEVRTYATRLLNYNPEGPISGSGENGLTGIVVDPLNGDVYASMLWDDPNDQSTMTVPKVTRFTSTDGGLTAATRKDIFVMRGAYQGQSHQVSNLTFGPDGMLYVHNGDGLATPETALNLGSMRGKILRITRDGKPPADNPFYNAADGITQRDHVFAYGLRNPFGGAWRASDGQHYQVENGPSIDRLAKVRRGVSYGWDGTNESMRTNALYNWTNGAVAPVNLAFVQQSTFHGSLFPEDKWDHAFVSESGPTYATGPQARGKRISEFVLGFDEPNGNVIEGPRTLVHYTGNGKGTVAALAAGADGLYFSDLYEDDPVGGVFQPTARGANILRVRYVGVDGGT